MGAEPKDVLDFGAAMGFSLYPWQAEICLTIDQAPVDGRTKIACRAPNGVGKTARVIVLSVLRWLQKHPTGKVVGIFYDQRQLADQFWQALRVHEGKFPQWKFRHHEYTIDTDRGGRLRAFTTDDA